MTLRIRDAAAADIGALHAIYAHHVLSGFGTFDETPPKLSEFEQKWRDVVACGLAWLVACDGNDVVGYAYASPFRPRSGYRYTLEDSVYIREDRRGGGIGRQLLAPLIARCETTGARQIVAVIGDSGNEGSIALHRKLGFAHAGTLKGVGFKFDRWVDVVIMQRPLNSGDATAPSVSSAWRPPE